MEALHQRTQGEKVRVLIIDVNESVSTGTDWANGHNLTFPVLLDTVGAVSASFAPEGLLPELPREQVPIGSNLLIDPDGKIQFYSLLDTKNFDAKLVALKARLASLREHGKPNNPPHAVSLLPIETVELRAGESATATISIEISEGFHLLADPGDLTTLVPARVELNAHERVSFAAPVYPLSAPLQFEGSETPFRVYSGTVQFTITLSIESNAEPGAQTVTGKLEYQSCNESTCFPPDSFDLTIPIKIVPAQ